MKRYMFNDVLCVFIVGFGQVKFHLKNTSMGIITVSSLLTLNRNLEMSLDFLFNQDMENCVRR